MTFGVVKGCSFACSVVRRIAQYVADLLEPEDKDKLYDNLLVGQSKVSGLSLGLAIEYSTESGYRQDFYPPVKILVWKQVSTAVSQPWQDFHHLHAACPFSGQSSSTAEVGVAKQNMHMAFNH